MCARPILLFTVFVSALVSGCGETPEPPVSASTIVQTDSQEAAVVDLDRTQPSPTTTETAPVSTMKDPQENCRRLTDFTVDEDNRAWLVVNDNVMGGQSLGGLAFEAGSLIFEGEINTDGGGFSSLRLALSTDALTAHDRIVFRARADSRSYMVTFDDSLASRDRRVSHRAAIGFDAPGDWETISVSFDELRPAVFGNPIDDLPFRKDLATRLGLMISDGVDGSFRLEIDWIDLCGV